MDFASDTLWTARRFRCLCLVDDATRESPALLPDEARRIIEAWRQHYHRERPHSALRYEPPERFARRLGAPGLDEGPRPSPALAPAPAPCYDGNASPSPWT